MSCTTGLLLPLAVTAGGGNCEDPSKNGDDNSVSGEAVCVSGEQTWVSGRCWANDGGLDGTGFKAQLPCARDFELLTDRMSIL